MQVGRWFDHWERLKRETRSIDFVFVFVLTDAMHCCIQPTINGDLLAKDDPPLLGLEQLPAWQD